MVDELDEATAAEQRGTAWKRGGLDADAAVRKSLQHADRAWSAMRKSWDVTSRATALGGAAKAGLHGADRKATEKLASSWAGLQRDLTNVLEGSAQAPPQLPQVQPWQTAGYWPGMSMGAGGAAADPFGASMQQAPYGSTMPMGGMANLMGTSAGMPGMFGATGPSMGGYGGMTPAGGQGMGMGPGAQRAPFATGLLGATQTGAGFGSLARSADFGRERERGLGRRGDPAFGVSFDDRSDGRHRGGDAGRWGQRDDRYGVNDGIGKDLDDDAVSMTVLRERFLKLRVNAGMKRQFRGFDTDGDRTLDFREFEEACGKLGVAMRRSALQRVFDAVDRSGSGKIS